MTSNDFEEGRKLQRLGNQIEQTHVLIMESINGANMKKLLTPTIKELFTEYNHLAIKHQIPRREIKNIKDIYDLYIK